MLLYQIIEKYIKQKYTNIGLYSSFASLISILTAYQLSKQNIHYSKDDFRNFTYFNALRSPHCHALVICLGIIDSLKLSLPLFPFWKGFQPFDCDMESITLISISRRTFSIFESFLFSSKEQTLYLICIDICISLLAAMIKYGLWTDKTPAES